MFSFSCAVSKHPSRVERRKGESMLPPPGGILYPIGVCSAQRPAGPEAPPGFGDVSKLGTRPHSVTDRKLGLSLD